MWVRLTRKNQIAADICEFHFVRADGKALPSFEAGAHIDVYLGAMIRQYSLCNDPQGSGSYVIGVLKESASRGGSAAMHALKEGDEIEIGEPKNHFALEESAHHSILIAGGIGITPLLAMSKVLARRGQSFELHYCVRDHTRAAFSDTLQQSRTRLYCDDDPSTGTLNLAEVLQTGGAGRHVYVCGPSGLIETCVDTARANGWADNHIHRESFLVASQSTCNDAFIVRLARSRKSLRVEPGQRLLDALLAAGIQIPFSCQEGNCGTCATRVLAGEPDHRDTFLTKKERARNDCILPCCSRSKTPALVLDL